MKSEDNPRPRVVFDCMVYLQATINESGPAASLLRLVENESLSLFTSREILDEVRDVLSRPRIRNKNPAITDERVDGLIARISAKATMVENIPHRFNYVRDPKDEKYVNLAVEVRADYIISFDKDLLDLMTGHANECKDFRRRFRFLKVVDPLEFLRTVEAKELNEADSSTT